MNVAVIFTTAMHAGFEIALFGVSYLDSVSEGRVADSALATSYTLPDYKESSNTVSVTYVVTYLTNHFAGASGL